VHPEAPHSSGVSAGTALTGASDIKELHTTTANANHQLTPPAAIANPLAAALNQILSIHKDRYRSIYSSQKPQWLSLNKIL